MKKLLPILILFCACQKEDAISPEKDVNDPGQSGELHAVTFELSGFTQHTEPMSEKQMSGKTSPVANDDPYDPSRPCYPACPGSRYDYDQFSWRQIKYYAYDEETGELVRNQRRTYGSEDYGTFTDSLPAGNYDIVFVMCWGESTDYDWEAGSPAIHYSSKFNEAVLSAYIGGAGGVDWFAIGGIPDLFFKHIKIEVSGDVVLDDIELPRIVGGIEVRLTDDSFPDDLLYLSSRYSTKDYFKFNEGATGNGSAYDQYWGVEQTDSGYYISKYVIPDTETGKLITDVEISAYRGEIGGPVDTIAHKVIHDIEIEANKKTILTGKLFDAGESTQEFTVKIDSSWTEGEVIEF